MMKPWIGALFGLVVGLVTLPSHADNAILMTKTVCDNQENTFTYDWNMKNTADLKLFYLSGTSVADAVITPIGHADAFDGFDDVKVSAHGNAGVIAGIAADTFADIFQNLHASTPDTVEFYACKAAQGAAGGGNSVQKALSLKYPGASAGETAVGRLAAGGLNCSLTGKAAAGDPDITKIEDATYKTGASKAAGFDAAVAALVTGWTTDLFPGSAKTFKNYCIDEVMTDPAANLQNFLNQTITKYGTDYLALINLRYAGTDLYECGNNAGLPNPCVNQ
ncbi:hypothetical protein [Eilatimonas milleporae]|nr:hypothetical protein [Eilatimonas milleporae]